MKRLKLIRLRIAKGLTMESLARKIGVSHTVVFRIESRGAIPRPANVPKLAEGYGITPKELVDIIYETEGGG